MCFWLFLRRHYSVNDEIFLDIQNYTEKDQNQLCISKICVNTHLFYGIWYV